MSDHIRPEQQNADDVALRAFKTVSSYVGSRAVGWLILDSIKNGFNTDIPETVLEYYGIGIALEPNSYYNNSLKAEVDYDNPVPVHGFDNHGKIYDSSEMEIVADSYCWGY